MGDFQHLRRPPFVEETVEPAFEHRELAFEIRNGYSQNNDNRRNEFEHECGHIEAERNRINETENERPENHSDKLNGDFSFARENAADKKRRKRYRDHSRADVYINGFLRLREQTTGKGGKRVCYAKPHNGGKRRIYRRRANHIGIVARGADGKPEFCFEKKRQNHANSDYGNGSDNKFVLSRQKSAVQKVFCLCENGVGTVHTELRGLAHDRDIHRIKRGVDDYSRKQAVNAHFRLKKRGYKARNKPCRHRGGNGKIRVTRYCDDRADGRSESEAAVGGKVADV